MDGSRGWQTRWSRRGFTRAAAGGMAAVALPLGSPRANAQAPAAITAEGSRPALPYGVQAGDIDQDRAIIWTRADRPARMLTRWSTSPRFDGGRAAPVVTLLENTDFTGKVDLTGLPPDQTIFYEVTALDLADLQTSSAPIVGRLRTPPAIRRDVRFVWSGDTVGQGWGINPDFGGLRIYRTMREAAPEFFIHSGDTIYADGPLEAEKETPDGGTWRNITTEAKSKVAESLAEFRGNYAYNMMDEHLRAFNAEVPMFAQWDDHEVTNNWYWEKSMAGDPRYAEESVALMASRASQAFFDYMPVRRHPLERNRLYTNFRWGPSLEIFRIDLRSYRGRNNKGLQTELSPEARILGSDQMRWLKQTLLASDATWKVIASDMPIGLQVWDGSGDDRVVEAIAQGDGGGPKGRELEVAELLRFIRDAGIRNVVWLTADVHYTAAHHYDPNRARFQEFAPFWEFVSGPLHAGSFGPNDLDGTFGPEAVFVKAPEPGQVNLPPSAGLQFFGQVDIEGASEIMTVRLKDIEGTTLYMKELTPEA
jgi:alkaline phosphatase D